MLWVRISIRARCTTLCDKVCQWLSTGRWFSPGAPVYSTNKTDRQDITEILLKVALTLSNQPTKRNGHQLPTELDCAKKQTNVLCTFLYILRIYICKYKLSVYVPIYQSLSTIDFLNDELINFRLNKCVPHNTKKFVFSVIIYF